MRFLIVSQYYPPEIGAPQGRLRGMKEALLRAGHEVEVVTAMPNYPTGRVFSGYRGKVLCTEVDGTVAVHRTWIYASKGAGLRRMWNYLSFAITAIAGIARAKRPDWIFVEAPPPTVALPALLAAWFWKVPVVLNVADLWPDSIVELKLITNRTVLRMLTALELFVYRKSAIITVVTDGAYRRLVEVKGVEPRRLAMLPNGVDTDSFRPLPPDQELVARLGLEGRKIFLFAGTLGYAQSLDRVLEAARGLMIRNPAIHFVFLGDGSSKAELIEKAQEWGLSNVTFHDPVPLKEVASFMSIATCGLVSLSDVPLFDGVRPSKMFPIMGCGKAVVYAGKGEGAEIVQRAKAGWVVPPEDPEALATALLDAAARPELAREYGMNGRKFVEENFTWDSLVGKWLGALETFSSAERNTPKR